MLADQTMLDADARRELRAQAMLEKREAAKAKHARERIWHIAYAIVGCIFLSVLLGVGVQRGWLPTSLRPAATPPKDEFAETRAGQIRTPVKNGTCRDLSFDNQNGRFAGGNEVPCNAVPEEVQRRTGTTGRINTIRDAFSR